MSHLHSAEQEERETEGGRFKGDRGCGEKERNEDVNSNRERDRKREIE